MAKTKFCTLLFFATLLVLASADFEDLFTEIRTVSTDPVQTGSAYQKVSLQGGIYLYIKGSGFSTRSASSNIVTLDNVVCPVVEFLTTATQVVCEVPPSDTFKTVTVKVTVDALRISSCKGSCYLTYDYWSTPQLVTLNPNAANPGDEIFFFGAQRVSTSLQVDYLKIGAYRCDPSDQNEFNSVTFVGGFEQAPCNVSTQIEAGYYQVSQRNLKSTGNATIMPSIPTYRFNGDPYDFVVAPKISSISSNVGSPDGQILTITGAGFSSTDQNEVFLADTPCNILESSSTEIKCELEARSTSIPTQGYHAGLKYEFYEGQILSAVKAGTAGSPIFESSRLVAELPLNQYTNYTSKLSGYFKAPRTGDYTFLIATDDIAQLYISTTPLEKTNLTLILDVTSYTDYRFFFTKGKTQQSSAVPLQADNLYYIEVYHQQSSGGDSLSLGVKIPNAQNTVSPTTEVQSIKLNCPTIPEILEFRISNANSGKWRIRFDYLSSDGKSISSSTRTSNMTHPAEANTVSSQINSAMSLSNTATVEMLAEDGSVTTDPLLAVTYVYTVTLNALRKNGVLPVIEGADLTGTSVTTKTTQLQEPSPAIGGTFTVTYAAQTAEISASASTSTVANLLRTIGYKEPIRVSRTGNVDLGAEWRIHFVGEGAGPVDQLSLTNTLTGCNAADPNGITITQETIQDSSQELFYEVIPIDLLFTENTKPQITVKSNGVLGNCPGQNCDYVIQSTGVPEITTASYSGTTLSVDLANIEANKYASNKLVVSLGNVACTVNTFVDTTSPATLTATCNAPEAGDHFPRIHFPKLGYALVNSGVSAITVPLTITGVSPSSINPNGGTLLTVTGSGFPASLALAQEREIMLLFGTIACVPTAVTPTSIQCINDPVPSATALSVGLNGKSGSTSVLSILTTVPSIDTVDPVSVNPVLQTDITIQGLNFDGSTSSTSVFLKNTATSEIKECLVSGTTTTQIVCKLLGAPTGTYKIYAQTSAGYTNSKDFTVETQITGISPSSGSIAGGTTITITGGAFSSDTLQTLVFIGADNLACNVVSSSSSQVVCVTAPLKTLTQAESQQRVYVDTRIVESAICPTTANCQFTYSSSLTPQITALDLSTVPAGGSLTITGTGLDSNPAGSAPTVKINGLTATVTSNSATQIVVTVPTDITPSKTSTITVNVAGKGDAQFVSPLTNVISVLPAINSITPAIGSTAGVLLTVTGAGIQEGAYITVDGTTCVTRSRTTTSITCKTTVSGTVRLLYSTWTNIQCSPACYLSFNENRTPTVGTISPLNPTSGTFTLTIPGTKFTSGVPQVVLISKADSSVTFTGSATVVSDTQMTVSFTGVGAGSYSIELSLDGQLAAVTATVTVPLTASPASSVVDSSLAGGAIVTLTGSGFFENAKKDLNKISICGFPCQVTSSSATSVSCTTPPFINSAVLAAYPSISASSVLTPAATWSDAGNEATVFDMTFTTNYTSTTAACYIGYDSGENLLSDISQIRFFPNPAITSSTLAGATIQGSSDKNTWTTIYTVTSNANDGWNTIRLDSNARYRYFRFNGGASPAKCALSELQFFGVVLSSNTASTLTSISCGAIVTLGDQTKTITSAVAYKQAATANLTSISPEFGTTAGGTELTLTGTSFETDTSKIQVSIDGVACTPISATATQIKCTTGAAPSISNRRNSLESSLVVTFTGKGNVVTNNIKYFYVDRWSDTNTWGGLTPPREGDSVSIPAGQTILLDTSPPKLKAIIVEGALIFEDKDLNLDAEYIMIREGRVQIGTPEKPIQNKITITMYGNKQSPHLPTFGNKVIALMGGILDIHGKPRSDTWTVLDRTASVGDNFIIVQGSVDWQIGEVIVIASTEHDHYLSESRTITGVQANTPSAGLTRLTLNEDLKQKHYAGVQTIDGQIFEMRAEVGLLTRNVVIQGDETSQKNQYGCHIMAHSPTGDDSSIGRISYTEVRQAGQAFNLGRYPIHFHMIGNVRQSYVLGNAVHHTYNRAITIHGVHNLKVQKNVAYWVMGHTIFIEDGIETHNVIEDNLVINTMASTSLLNTDQTPASFWITNPNNIFRRNRAAGSDRYGFWFDLREHPEGPSATPSICPVGERLGEFTDNQAHSSGRYGLRIFHELIPRTFPCRDVKPYEDNLPVPAEFKNFLGWKNMRNAVIGERLGAVTFSNIKAADNLRAGIEISDGDWSPPYTLRVKDSYIVGTTPENGGDLKKYTDRAVKGLITPKKEYFLASGVTFSNFAAGMYAIETCSHCEHPAATTEGAITSYTEKLKFFNVVQRVRFNIPEREIIIDNDGTLVGNSNGGSVTFFYHHLNVPGCTLNEAVYDGLVCDKTVTIRKVELRSLNPAASFTMQLLDVLNTGNLARDDQVGSIEYRKQRESWAVPFVTGYSYKLSWRSRADFNSLDLIPASPIAAGDGITLTFNHSDIRETYDLIGQTNMVNITNKTTLWSSANTQASARTCGDWHHDFDNRLLHVVMTNNVKQEIKVNAVKCRLNCPVYTTVPKDGAVRVWSNATQWPGGVLPKDGDDVEIPGEWVLKLDMSTPSLGYLHVKGDLHFDNSKDDLVLTAKRIWVEGQLFIGNNTDERFTRNAKIVLTGDRKSTSLVIGPVQDVSNKVLAVTGNVTMYGTLVNHVWTRLLASAQAGASTITLPADLGWKVGDEIFIAPTQRSEIEAETRKIITVGADGVLTLNESLKYYHFGAATVTKETTVGNLDMRAEVGLLTRNIKIEGTYEDHWGARLYIGEVYETTYQVYLRGRADLDGVEMRNVGQANTTLAGLTFDKLTSQNNGASTVTRSVVRDSQGVSLLVSGSSGVTLQNNIFFRSYRYQILLEGANADFIFQNNLAIENLGRGVVAGGGDVSVDWISLVYSLGTFLRSDISGNVFAGCNMTCMTARGGKCSGQPQGPYTIHDNLFHSAEYGWVATEPEEACNGITHFAGHHVDYGIVSMFKSKKIVASNIILSDITKYGVSLNPAGFYDTSVITLSDSYFLSQSGEASSYTNKEACSHSSPVMISASVRAAKKIPPGATDLPIYKVKSDHNWKADFIVSGLTFENFKDNYVQGCTGNTLFVTNPYASDYSAITKTSNLNLINVGTENLVRFNKPEDSWIGVDNCGGWYCTGISNAMIQDTDGTLTGTPASLMPSVPTTFDANTCTRSLTQNAQICKTKRWGVLTFESQDIDYNTRIVSPINVTTSDGFRNDLNSYMDHVWDGFYTGLKRWSRFHSIVQAARDYLVLFTGTPPNAMRWALQGAMSPSDAITAQFAYPNPQSVRITASNGSVIKQTIIQTGGNSIVSTDPCGTNTYSIDDRQVRIKLTGEETCELKTTLVNSVQASIRYSTTVEEFFAQNGPTLFIDRVAAILGINPASIRIVEIKSGSTIVRYFIDSQYQGNETRTTVNANTELKEFVRILTQNVENNGLSILGARILDSSFEIILTNPEDLTESTSKTNTVVIIVAASVAGLALLIGAYFTTRRYFKKRIVPAASTEAKNIKASINKFHESYLNTENPLFGGTSRIYGISQTASPDLKSNVSVNFPDSASPERPVINLNFYDNSPDKIPNSALKSQYSDV